MIKILFCTFILTLSGFAVAKPYDLSKSYLNKKSCPASFEKETKKKLKSDFEEILRLYKLYPCFPTQSLQILQETYPDETWVFNQLANTFMLVPLSPEEELILKATLYTYTRNSSGKERNLTSQIALKKKLDLDYTEQENKLRMLFPSHDPIRLKKPDLRLVKDFKRRGMNEKALELLIKMNRKSPLNYSVHKQLIQTQKNIKRNHDYLRYSQRYVNVLYRQYKRNKRNKRNRRLYINEALRNIRRIWTYESTQKALTKLTTLIRYHCRIKSECAEHYWIKGRIYEELQRPKEAHLWLLKAAQVTSRSSSEYINRVWNLVWLENKVFSPQKAFLTAKTFIYNLPSSAVSSKLYFWMSRWSSNREESLKYIDLIKKHHPLSFYLWSPLALGEKMPLTTTPLKQLKSKIKSKYERNLYKLIEIKEPSLTRNYIRFAQKQIQRKDRGLTWKRLKALSGQYADLLIELESGRIKAQDNIQYFFSRAYNENIAFTSKKFNVEKELIWSIIRQESNFNTFARSWADAFGLMQVLPRRAINYLNFDSRKKKQAVQQINPFKLYEPAFNIQVGTWLLQQNSETFDSKLPLTIASYNASVDKVKEWERRFYKGDWLHLIEEITYRETRKYVKLVLRNREIYKNLITN